MARALRLCAIFVLGRCKAIQWLEFPNCRPDEMYLRKLEAFGPAVEVQYHWNYAASGSDGFVCSFDTTG